MNTFTVENTHMNKCVWCGGTVQHGQAEMTNLCPKCLRKLSIEDQQESTGASVLYWTLAFVAAAVFVWLF